MVGSELDTVFAGRQLEPAGHRGDQFVDVVLVTINVHDVARRLSSDNENILSVDLRLIIMAAEDDLRIGQELQNRVDCPLRDI
ncbi:hypothetical protein D3C76_1595710 [compost metagenome]